MHPKAVLRAASTSSVAAQLARTTAHAALQGVSEMPAITLQGSVSGSAGEVLVFQGERALERASAALERAAVR